MADLNISALPANHCLQIGGFTIGFNVAPIDECGWIRSFVTIPDDHFFWTEGTFEVLYLDEIVVACAASAGVCEMELD